MIAEAAATLKASANRPAVGATVDSSARDELQRTALAVRRLVISR
jgi:hypothetical protein